MKTVKYLQLPTYVGLLLILTTAQVQAQISKDCSFHGTKLYGKVQFVDSFADIKVQLDDSFPDLNVQFVSAFADSCGKWQIVDAFPDFKVQIVSSFGDIKIKQVNAFPGIR